LVPTRAATALPMLTLSIDGGIAMFPFKAKKSGGMLTRTEPLLDQPTFII
jgi:hypothetical protein